MTEISSSKTCIVNIHTGKIEHIESQSLTEFIKKVNDLNHNDWRIFYTVPNLVDQPENV